MKIKSLITIAAFLFCAGFLKSQTSINWQTAAIGMDGTNGYNGVEVYYALSTCNANEVVSLKLINHNNYDVKAQWINVVVSNDGKEHYGSSKLVSYKLAANAEVIGDCKDKTATLTFKLSDYGIKASDLRIFVGSNFDVTKK